MWHRGHIPDALHAESACLQGTDSSLSSASGALYTDINLAEPVFHFSPCHFGSSALRSIGSPFTSPLKSSSATTSPSNNVSLKVSKGDDGIIKGGLDICSSPYHPLTLASFNPCCFLLCCHDIYLTSWPCRGADLSQPQSYEDRV